MSWQRLHHFAAIPHPVDLPSFVGAGLRLLGDVVKPSQGLADAAAIHDPKQGIDTPELVQALEQQNPTRLDDGQRVRRQCGPDHPAFGATLSCAPDQSRAASKAR